MGVFILLLFFILSQSLGINNEVVLAPKLCIECSRYVTRGRGKNLSKKATSTYTYTRPCTQNWRIMFELTKRSIYFCPFYSCARYRVLDLHRTGFVVSHPTLAGVIPNNNLYWKPVSLCVVHSDTSTRLIVYFKVILSTYYIGFIIRHSGLNFPFLNTPRMPTSLYYLQTGDLGNQIYHLYGYAYCFFKLKLYCISK